jgi:IS5 family transposase
MSHFRERITPDVLEKLLQESLSAAYQAGALSMADSRKVAIDTTVQEKAVAHPTEHGLMLKAIMKLGDVAKACEIKVRQSYKRVAKEASIMVGRYLHAR